MWNFMKLIFIVLRVIVFILFSTTYFYIIPGEITWDAGLSSLQSIRETQEDYASFMAFEYLEKPGLIATVFDGHGGDAVSKQGNEFFCNRYIEKLKKVVASEPNEPLQLVLQKTFSSYSKHLNRDCRDYLKVGSTCIAAVIYDGRCYFGNLGDSRGFLKTKEHFFCTNDHKYTNDTEKPYCEKVLPN